MVIATLLALGAFILFTKSGLVPNLWVPPPPGDDPSSKINWHFITLASPHEPSQKAPESPFIKPNQTSVLVLSWPLSGDESADPQWKISHYELLDANGTPQGHCRKLNETLDEFDASIAPIKDQLRRKWLVLDQSTLVEKLYRVYEAYGTCFPDLGAQFYFRRAMNLSEGMGLDKVMGNLPLKVSSTTTAPFNSWPTFTVDQLKQAFSQQVANVTFKINCRLNGSYQFVDHVEFCFGGSSSGKEHLIDCPKNGRTQTCDPHHPVIYPQKRKQ